MKSPPHGIFAADSSATGRRPATSRKLMTVFSAVPNRPPRTRSWAHAVPIVLGGIAAGCAVALVAYLLWPTWGTRGADAPDKLPVSVGGMLFNLPVTAIRMKIQRHSGPQERIDLDFLYPSLEPPSAPKHVTADTVEAAVQSIDRIFLSIAAHHDALSPEQRTATIYPRYLDKAGATPADGLTMRMFRADTPYGSEDFYSAASPALTARCTRDAATPGMCLSERRVGGADLTFRYPRSWLSQWHDVAEAMDRLTAQLRGPKG